MSAASAAFLLGAAACLLCLLPLLLLFPALRWRATAALHTLAPARLGVGAMFSFFSRSAAPAAAPSSRAGEHHPGLRNTGNTCYLNSVLQSLASLPGLTRFLLQLEADAEAERGTREMKAASKTRYTCPRCSVNAWAKPGTRLACGVCTVPLEPEQR